MANKPRMGSDPFQKKDPLGWIGSDRTYPGSPERPASDIEILRPIVARIEELVR